MELPFTHRPGRRERHLLRQHENPLFAWPPREVQPEELLEAQRQDHEDMEAFREAFRALVQRVADLQPEADSDTLLGLKEALERLYEQSYALPEDHARERTALRKLISLIMQAVKRAAGNDPLARQELADEQEAREIHFRLLEQPLLADLLHPDSSIGPELLAPTVLSASLEEVAAVLESLVPEECTALAEQALRLLNARAAAGVDVSASRARLELILAHASSPRTDLNPA